MKNFVRISVCIALILTVVLGCCGCGRNTENQGLYEKLISDFEPSLLNVKELVIGQTDKPSASVWSQGGMIRKLNVVSTDESVVTVSEDGKVTAVGEGSAYVIFDFRVSRFSRGLQEIYRYDVYADVFDQNMDTECESVTMHLGEQDRLSGFAGMGKCYSSDESVVAVAEDGTVTAVGIGTAYILYEVSVLHSEMYCCTVVQDSEAVTP